MIKLRNMTAGEFIDYRRLFIGEYARDLSANHGYGIEQGRINAIASIDGYLPRGMATPDNQLLCIEAGDAVDSPDEPPVAGYLWIGCKNKTAYILDFFILPAWRRRGLGRDALAQLDRQLRAQGVTELGLRVAADNPGARALYDECGFRVTGVNMVKPL
ncbi:GNAT family N-acetyltransferase [Acerihabitans sp.]|uniref:GNAT family N-acetyltransferase n=1 Tax=Acerihabitans sp. TaxID=2811394 RepID=UPI002ED83FB9